MKPSESSFLHTDEPVTAPSATGIEKVEKLESLSHSTDSTFSIGGGARTRIPVQVLAIRRSACHQHHHALAVIQDAAPLCGTEHRFVLRTRKRLQARLPIDQGELATSAATAPPGIAYGSAFSSATMGYASHAVRLGEPPQPRKSITLLRRREAVLTMSQTCKPSAEPATRPRPIARRTIGDGYSSVRGGGQEVKPNHTQDRQVSPLFACGSFGWGGVHSGNLFEKGIRYE